MGNNSQWGERQGEPVRITVFRLNGKVGMAVQQGGNTPPVFLSPEAAYHIADQLLDEADECSPWYDEISAQGTKVKFT